MGSSPNLDCVVSEPQSGLDSSFSDGYSISPSSQINPWTQCPHFLRQRCNHSIDIQTMFKGKRIDLRHQLKTSPGMSECSVWVSSSLTLIPVPLPCWNRGWWKIPLVSWLLDSRCHCYGWRLEFAILPCLRSCSIVEEQAWDVSSSRMSFLRDNSQTWNLDYQFCFVF